jgi:hypothetical protein
LHHSPVAPIGNGPALTFTGPVHVTPITAPDVAKQVAAA